ncbi:MAG: response regulator [Planctomycetota bacterium]|nr:response regulator [Planctomycetota bacterium]
MKLESLEVQSLRRAIEIFIECAFPDDPKSHYPRVPFEEESVSRILEGFEDESRYPGENENRKFVLRIGNERFRHMKLSLEEYLVPGEFYFSVDTHDQVDILFEATDGDFWKGIQEYNRSLKNRIEELWRAEGLPTMQTLQVLLKSEPRERSSEDSPRILLADDDEDILRNTALLLESQGYEVVLARDGMEVMEQISQVRPDLMVLDFLMPRMDGHEVCCKVRENPDLAGIPILLTTATSLRMERIRDADGFLLKPFQGKVLLDYIQHLLRGDVRKAVLLRRHAPDPQYAARVRTERVDRRQPGSFD